MHATHSLAGPSTSQRRVAFSRTSSSTSTSRPSRGSLQVVNAITREKKAAIVERLKGKLDESVVVFGFNFKGLDVVTQQKFRRGLPEKSSMVITKNSLMKVAATEQGNFSMVAEKGCTGDNAWVFVNEDEIADVVKHYFSFAGDLEKEAKAAAAKDVKVTSFPAQLTCAVMDNKYLTPADLKRCENLPNKKQLYATIARLIKQPAQKLAVGIKMVPTKLAYGVKALADLDEDKAKLVGDVAKPKAADA